MPGEPPASHVVKPIGFVQSRYRDYDDVPHTHGKPDEQAAEPSRIVLLPEYAKELAGMDGFSHVIVLFWVHRAEGWRLPKGHSLPEWVGVLATRMPRRPNPIGLSVVRLAGFSAEAGTLDVAGLDCLDGTPVLDVKPYVPWCDHVPDATVPEWVRRKRAAMHSHEHDSAGRHHGTGHGPAGGQPQDG